MKSTYQRSIHNSNIHRHANLSRLLGRSLTGDKRRIMGEVARSMDRSGNLAWRLRRSTIGTHDCSVLSGSDWSARSEGARITDGRSVPGNSLCMSGVNLGELHESKYSMSGEAGRALGAIIRWLNFQEVLEPVTGCYMVVGWWMWLKCT